MALTAFINLTTSEISIDPTDQELLDRWLGGRGLGAALLHKLVPPKVNPFDPENYLIFTNGALSGTPWPTASRYHVTFKSPATGAYGYANAGGYFGPELRNAGFDALVITGKAPTPSILEVIDENVQIISAPHLWGKTTSETEAALTKANGGRVASIGKAGENLVLIAGIINDGGRAAARSGPGAVMGSKNLKGVHVLSTSKRAPTSPSFRKIVKETSKHVANDPNTEGLKNETTLSLMRIKNIGGDLPAKNHQSAQVPFINKIDSQAFSKYWVKRKGCAACPIRCSRNSEIQDGGKTLRIEGPEYETTDAFGPMLWNGNPELVIKANYLCNEYGLDTISTGVTIAFAMECHEKGILDDPNLSLEWGDADTITGLIDKIAHREGLGDILANGVFRAAQKIGNGAEQYALHVKGVELPRQEPRTSKGFGLGHATGNRGADHLYALPTIDLAGRRDVAEKVFPAEIVDELMDTANEKYKPDVVIYGEHFCAVADSLGLCKFSTAETYSVMADQLAKGLSAIGCSCTGADLLEIGERIVNLERLYNTRHGFDRRNDKLPKRFTEEPLEIYEYTPDPSSDHPKRSKKPIIVAKIEDFEAMLDRYYQLRGWDENGRPLPETLERLEIVPD